MGRLVTLGLATLVASLLAALPARADVTAPAPAPASASANEGEAPADEASAVAPPQGSVEPPHPLPRVTVDVVSAKGGVSQASLQASARRNFWSKAVACYRKGAYLDQHLKVNLAFDVEVAHGKARVTKGRKKLKVGKGKVAQPRDIVEACITEAFPSLVLPAGKRTSAKINVRVSPGDEPMAPPYGVSEKQATEERAALAADNLRAAEDKAAQEAKRAKKKKPAKKKEARTAKADKPAKTPPKRSRKKS